MRVLLNNISHHPTQHTIYFDSITNKCWNIILYTFILCRLNHLCKFLLMVVSHFFLATLFSFILLLGQYRLFLRNYQQFNHCCILVPSILIQLYTLCNIGVKVERCKRDSGLSVNLCYVKTLCKDVPYFYIYHPILLFQYKHARVL